jgi:hypothetical protein
MILKLYLDMPKDDPEPGLTSFAMAFARPAFAVAEGWTRWRIDLDLAKNEASIRTAEETECVAFKPWTHDDPSP